jgi:hypothetical protein
VQHVKHVFQYLLLVGVPFVGLLGVLRVGRDLTAPMAVHGDYHAGRMDSDGGPCPRTLLADSTLTITQSGGRIEVLVGAHAVRLSGRLEGDRLSASGELPAADGCPAGERVSFEAQATRTAGRVTLEGRMQAECAACGSARFDATSPRPAGS